MLTLEEKRLVSMFPQPPSSTALAVLAVSPAYLSPGSSLRAFKVVFHLLSPCAARQVIACLLFNRVKLSRLQAYVKYP